MALAVGGEHDVVLSVSLVLSFVAQPELACDVA